ncbi:hypothetical protein Zmor_006091 [Zophobas morio]|uniref:Uncharacterized protein n=1 Tax=Zophobas morio TaxID=2755281 RepID=A0AA38IFS9_9CUCU|nr:hypothetical protein Zmor_014727 [Zophobas morio]KAJ3661704.1 hypothetical protein Zmor_006091 [Zophobas morio]
MVQYCYLVNEDSDLCLKHYAPEKNAFRNFKEEVTVGEKTWIALRTFIFSKFDGNRCFFVKYLTGFTGIPFCKSYNNLRAWQKSKLKNSGICSRMG